ncbi:MAG: oligosaccharide flippase family protein [Bacteroidales bacterium]
MNREKEERLEIESSEQEKNTQYKDLLKYTGLFGGVQGMNIISSIVRNKLTALLLGPAGLGVISLFNSVIVVLNNVSNLGISFSGIRNLSNLTQEEDPQKMIGYIQVIRVWSILTALSGICLCCLFAGRLSQWTFGNELYTSSFRWLSLVIGFTSLTGGELAILKGMRRLREVAISSVIATFLSIFFVIPLYFFYRESAIVPALIGVSAIMLLSTFFYSLKVTPFRKSTFSFHNIKAGKSLVKLGISFVIAGTLGAITEYLIRTFILSHGSVDMVGIYNTGLVLCVSYMGMVFVAIDNDYFSKLSAINKDTSRSNELINNQIELSVVLISPLIVGLLVFLPAVIRILYSSPFLDAMPMVEWAWVFMLLKGYNLSMAYVALSKGDSRTYLYIELVGQVLYLLCSFFCFSFFGLAGLGMGMSLSAICETLILWGCISRKYHFRFTTGVLKVTFAFLPFLAFAFLLTRMSAIPEWFYWLSGTLSFLLSAMLSFYLLNKRADLLNTIRDKFRN